MNTNSIGVFSPISKHARSRIQQRGIAAELVRLVVDYHDIAVNIGDGCDALTVSRSAVLELQQASLPPDQLEKVNGVCLVVRRDTGLIVTALHVRGSRGRFYRRQGPVWRRRLVQHSASSVRSAIAA